MNQGRRNFYLISFFITAIFVITSGLSWFKVGDSSLFQRIDAASHDRLFRLRNYLSEKGFLHHQPISSEVTLIGIDDATFKELGQFGKGSWLTRGPFISQLEYFRNVYHPAIIAYDFIFAEFEEQGQRSERTLSKEELRKIEEEVRNLANGESSEIDNDILVDVARLTIVEGNSNLARELSFFMGVQANPTIPIIAYDYTDPASNFDRSRRSWSKEEILGGDENNLSEDNGTQLPYLRDVSIPMDYVKNVPSNLEFSRYATMPTSSFLDYARLGFINVPRDEGGIVRRLPLVQGMETDYYPHPTTGEQVRQRFFIPSFSLICCLYYWGIDLVKLNATGAFEVNGTPVIEVILGECIAIRKPTGEMVRIPIDGSGNFFLDFVGRVKDFNTVSFYHVGLQGAYKNVKDLLFRKIALIGLTATGSTDTGPTPVSDHSPFVLVHMMAVNNILTQTFTLPLKTGHQLIVMAAIWLIVLLATFLLRPVIFTYFTVVLMTVYSFLVLFFSFTHRYTLPVSGPAILIVGSYLPVLLCYYFSELKEKKRIRNMFSTMVSGEVLEYLEDNPESFSLEGARMEATMFFSDVAGFTTISESLSPEKLVGLLNRYLSPMTEIIMDSHGYVDKYEGDAIMAEWGVPFQNEEHAKLACWAALDQQDKISELRPIFFDEFGIEINVRMGLNSGYVSAGNMGSEKRMSYTVMGDAVNQAARFEPANKEYATSILIGQSTFESAKNDIEVRLLDKIVVKGKTVPITIYELVAKKGELTSDQRKVIELYRDGLLFHWERKWDSSLSCFRNALAVIPNDGPSLALIRRVEQYTIHPPPVGWQGEFIRSVKD